MPILHRKNAALHVAALLVGALGQGALYGVYGYLDGSLFASLRPLTLYSAFWLLSASLVILTCYTLLLIRMIQSEQDRTLGIVAALLTPCLGIGFSVVFFWTLLQAFRKSAASAEHKEVYRTYICWWSGALLANVVLAVYLGLGWIGQSNGTGIHGPVASGSQPGPYIPDPPSLYPWAEPVVHDLTQGMYK